MNKQLLAALSTSVFIALGLSFPVLGQHPSTALSIDKIMRDPEWIGGSPEQLQWDPISGNLYFRWNPEGAEYAALYRLEPQTKKPVRMEEAEAANLSRRMNYSQNRDQGLVERNGDLYVWEKKSGETRRLTQTSERKSDPRFSSDGKKVIYQRGNNLYTLSLVDGHTEQLTDFAINKTSEGKKEDSTEQQTWLKEQQLDLFDVLNQDKRKKAVQDSLAELRKEKGLRTLKLGEGENLLHLEASPDLRYIAYTTMKPAKGNKNTFVPDWVTRSGYTEEMRTRTKVGDQPTEMKAYLYDRERDTVLVIQTKGLPGIKDIPTFYEDYPDVRDSLKKKDADRIVSISSIQWNPGGSQAVLIVGSFDHKDRWITRLNLETGSLESLDRQHDDAWIAGPGIGGSWYGGNTGWIDEHNFYFQSEESGYSHLYRVDVRSGNKTALTSGNFEVQGAELSPDKKLFYITANKEHPGITHFYHLPAKGGELRKITREDGGNEVQVSPDGKWLAIRHSTANQPWELFLQENKAGTEASRITTSTSEEFRAYDWKTPDFIEFKNRHGNNVHARLYQPEKPKENRPAVVFVHGAGYLQNAHQWWSSYFREYFFHNFLVDQGYTVLDIDYTGSAGYGRDHRTGIYRHMGGKDLTDQVDGVKLLVDKYGVNPKNVGLYGGSYGGFITLMALFNEAETFASGAALRSVTDWAHYNHGYTSNILNEPFNDPKAYERSSPINFAAGLKGHLLMCHGMVDVNVHFQDIVRLSQRLIELGKEDWELAVYPVEDHGFVKASSWTDEYKRIFKLFEQTLNRP